MKYAFILAFVILLAGCGDRRAPVPTQPAVKATVVLSNLQGEAAEGARLWREKQCVACHGPTALGGVGRPLANTALPFDRFLSQVRNAIPPKPPLGPADLSDNQAYSIYLWLLTLTNEPAKAAAPAAAPLPAGQILGIQLWAEKGCNACHGAFGQGSVRGPALVGETYPFERQRAVMRQTLDQNPAHTPENIDDELLRRLLDWLRRGADPAGGC